MADFGQLITDLRQPHCDADRLTMTDAADALEQLLALIDPVIHAWTAIDEGWLPELAKRLHALAYALAIDATQEPPQPHLSRF